MLNSNAIENPFALQLAWQRDLDTSMDDSCWKSLWNSSLHKSRNTNISMLSHKTTYRLHLTLYKLHRINSSLLDKCWKGCGLPSTYLHCFWSCTKLTTFWEQVLQQVIIISELTIPSVPELAILNLWRSLKTDPLCKELVELLLCVARHLIATLGNSPRIPTLKAWYLKVWDYFLQDKISVSILKSESLPVPDNLQENWLPLLSAASSRLIDTSLFAEHAHYDLLSYF